MVVALSNLMTARGVSVLLAAAAWAAPVADAHAVCGYAGDPYLQPGVGRRAAADPWLPTFEQLSWETSALHPGVLADGLEGPDVVAAPSYALVELGHPN